MVEILDQLAELKELKALYKSGDLREYDFNVRIQHLEDVIAKFEADMAPEEDARLVRNQDLWLDPKSPAWIKISHKEGTNGL